MKFAKYWKSVTVPVDKKFYGRDDVSVWGASNESGDLALANAQDRAAKFRKLVESGFTNKEEYEYWNGFIKEEIIDEIKSDDGRDLAVLTRNSYGATVLNSESILFGDMDLPISTFLNRILEKFGKPKKDKTFLLGTIEAYQKNNPDMSIKVYETSAGIRFVITNKIFNSMGTEVDKLFSELAVDPLYKRLCKQQTCFRARLTPKPWRINLDRPGSRFPRSIGKEQNDFEDWLKKYQLASAEKSVVKELATFGTSIIHPDVDKVLRVHDRYACGTSLALA